VQIKLELPAGRIFLPVGILRWLYVFGTTSPPLTPSSRNRTEIESNEPTSKKMVKIDVNLFIIFMEREQIQKVLFWGHEDYQKLQKEISCVLLNQGFA